MKNPTPVTIIARVEFKSNSKKVCYICLSSDGATKYQTCLFDGRATGCNCPARGRCRHMAACEAREAERQAVARKYDVVSEAAQVVAASDDRSAWTRYQYGYYS